MHPKLKQTISEVLGVDPGLVNEDSSVDTLAEWDSLRHMNLIFALEDAFGIRFGDEEVAQLTSVAALQAAIADRN
ncbi:acyl carrier protein [bacterium BD-1]|nr:acyl carrier protein [Ottowia caeni]